MEEDATAVPVIMLGLTGFGVLGAGEYGGELEVLVETTETLTGCPECGVVATPHGRRDHLVRDIPSADRPVLGGVAQAVVALRGAAVRQEDVVGDPP